MFQQLRGKDEPSAHALDSISFAFSRSPQLSASFHAPIKGEFEDLEHLIWNDFAVEQVFGPFLLAFRDFQWCFHSSKTSISITMEISSIAAGSTDHSLMNQHMAMENMASMSNWTTLSRWKLKTQLLAMLVRLMDAILEGKNKSRTDRTGNVIQLEVREVW